MPVFDSLSQVVSHAAAAEARVAEKSPVNTLVFSHTGTSADDIYQDDV